MSFPSDMKGNRSIVTRSGFQKLLEISVTKNTVGTVCQSSVLLVASLFPVKLIPVYYCCLLFDMFWLFYCLFLTYISGTPWKAALIQRTSTNDYSGKPSLQIRGIDSGMKISTSLRLNCSQLLATLDEWTLCHFSSFSVSIRELWSTQTQLWFTLIVCKHDKDRIVAQDNNWFLSNQLDKDKEPQIFFTPTAQYFVMLHWCPVDGAIMTVLSCKVTKRQFTFSSALSGGK